VATCPGSLIVHTDGMPAGYTEDDERDGCRAAAYGTTGARFGVSSGSANGCNYCGVH
jgi:hypothetical protein